MFSLLSGFTVQEAAKGLTGIERPAGANWFPALSKAYCNRRACSTPH
jgi:hypothetical protein